MSNPTQRQLHIDRPLSEISIAYLLDRNNLIADSVFPIINVKSKSDAYFKYNKDDYRRITAQERAPYTRAARGGFNLESDSYLCKKFAIAKEVSQDDIDNADSPLEPMKDAVEYVTEQLLLLRESEFMNKFFKTGSWTNEVTPSTLWDNTSSDPIGDIKDAKADILKETNREPNVLVLGYEIYNKLTEHPTIADKIKYTQTGIVTTDILAKVFDVEKVLVSKSSYNTAARGATANNVFLAGKHALLAYVAPRPALLTPTAGYIFSWKDANGYKVQIKKWFENDIDAYVIEGEMNFALEKVGDDLAVFFKDAVA